MDHNQFIMATAATLFAAFMLGWFAHWVLHRLTRVTHAEIGAVEHMARQLHDAEAARDDAIARAEEMSARASEADARRDETENSLTEAVAEIEELREYIHRRLRQPS